MTHRAPCAAAQGSLYRRPYVQSQLLVGARGDSGRDPWCSRQPGTAVRAGERTQVARLPGAGRPEPRARVRGPLRAAGWGTSGCSPPGAPSGGSAPHPLHAQPFPRPHQVTAQLPGGGCSHGSRRWAGGCPLCLLPGPSHYHWLAGPRDSRRPQEEVVGRPEVRAGTRVVHGPRLRGQAPPGQVLCLDGRGASLQPAGVPGSFPVPLAGALPEPPAPHLPPCQTCPAPAPCPAGHPTSVFTWPPAGPFQPVGGVGWGAGLADQGGWQALGLALGVAWPWAPPLPRRGGRGPLGGKWHLFPSPWGPGGPVPSPRLPAPIFRCLAGGFLRSRGQRRPQLPVSPGPLRASFLPSQAWGSRAPGAQGGRCPREEPAWSPRGGQSEGQPAGTSVPRLLHGHLSREGPLKGAPGASCLRPSLGLHRPGSLQAPAPPVSTPSGCWRCHFSARGAPLGWRVRVGERSPGRGCPCWRPTLLTWGCLPRGWALGSGLDRRPFEGVVLLAVECVGRTRGGAGPAQWGWGPVCWWGWPPLAWVSAEGGGAGWALTWR